MIYECDLRSEKRTQSADPGPGGYGPGDLTGGAFSRTNCAKQTQFAFEQNEGQVLWGTAVMVTCTCKGSWQNKANCPKRGTEAVSGGTAPAGPGLRYKQTQFGGTNCAKQTQLPLRRQEGQRFGGKEVMVNSTFDRPRQNKPNLGKPGWDPGGRLCKTKPIPRLGIADFGLRIVRNEPNLEEVSSVKC